ncbi:DNA pilot protein [Dipodfec virus UOA04_Rod_567]|nr:DNA pilot protein [Dipodfec virus UOA04_Rod_567]
MDPLIGGALVGAGASIINGIGSLFGSSSGSKRQFRQNKELMAIQQGYNQQNMQLQYDLNNQMFDYQNDASRQVENLTRAGINPLGADGFTPASNVGSSSAASAGLPSMTALNDMQGFPNFASAISDIASAKLKANQATKTEVETEYERIKTAHAVDFFDGQNSLQWKKGSLTDQQIETLAAQKLKFDQDVASSIAQIEQGWKSLELKQQEVQISKMLADLRAEVDRGNLSLSAARFAVEKVASVYRNNLMAAQTAKTYSDIDVNQSDIIKNRAEAEFFAHKSVGEHIRNSWLPQQLETALRKDSANADFLSKLADATGQKAELLDKENSAFWINQVLGWLDKVVSIIGGTASSASTFSSLGGASTSAGTAVAATGGVPPVPM